MPYLIEQGFSKGELGVILSAVSIAYGLSKFLMGIVSDRCNPRYFLATGLFYQVSLILFSAHFLSLQRALYLCLYFSFKWMGTRYGMASLCRTMVHWFSISERGTKCLFGTSLIMLAERLCLHL